MYQQNPPDSLKYTPPIISLTPAGLSYLIVSLVIGVTGLFVPNEPLFLLSCFMLASLVVAAVFSHLLLTGIVPSRAVPHEQFAGDAVQIELTLENHRSFICCNDVLVEDLVLEGDGRRQRIARATADWIPPMSRAVVPYSLRLHMRGEAKFTTLRLSSWYPFGFFRAVRQIPLEGTTLVLPRVSRMAAPPTAHTSKPGGREGLTLRGEEEFAGLREFRLGDNPKWIHWRASARYPSRLLVREFEAPWVRGAWVFFESHVGGIGRHKARRRALENSICMVSGLVWALACEGWRITFWSLIPHPFTIEVKFGDGSFGELLRVLAVLSPPERSGLDQTLKATDVSFFAENRVIVAGHDVSRQYANAMWAELVDFVDFR